MSAVLDPVELLNSLEPSAGWNTPPDLATDERAATILDRVVSGNVVPFRAPRRRLRIATGVVAVFALGGAGVAALLQRDSGENRTLACWSDTAPAVVVAIAWNGTDDAVKACTDPWRNGDLGRSGPPQPLQLCTTEPDGVVAAIPGNDDTCTALGLAPVAPVEAVSVPIDDVDALEMLLKKKYNQATCFTEQETLDGVRRTLEEFKFDGWATQTLSTDGAAETCTSISVDRAMETVNVTTRNPPDEAPN